MYMKSSDSLILNHPPRILHDTGQSSHLFGILDTDTIPRPFRGSQGCNPHRFRVCPETLHRIQYATTLKVNQQDPECIVSPS